MGRQPSLPHITTTETREQWIQHITFAAETNAADTHTQRDAYRRIPSHFEPLTKVLTTAKLSTLENHLILLKARYIERMLLHDAVKPIQLLQMVLQLHFIFGQLTQRLFLFGRQLFFLVMSRKLEHPVRWKLLIRRQLMLSSRNKAQQSSHLPRPRRDIFLQH